MKGGTGWGGGRGRITAEENSIKTSNVYSWSKIGRGRPENKFTPPMNRGMYNSNEKWKPSGFGRGGSGGIDENKFYGRAKPANNNVWQKRSSIASTPATNIVWQTNSSIASTSNQVWRQSEQQNAAPSSQAYSPWRPNQSLNSATSTWSPRMGGQHEVHNSYMASWNSRNSDAASSERTGPR